MTEFSVPSWTSLTSERMNCMAELVAKHTPGSAVPICTLSPPLEPVASITTEPRITTATTTRADQHAAI